MIRMPKKTEFLAIFCLATCLGFISKAHAQARSLRSNANSKRARAQAKLIFSERCAVCHGVDGGGDGPAASNLNPRPVSFRNAKWQASATDQRIAKVIVNGGTSVGLSASMASNPDLADQPEVVAALVKHVRSFAK